METPRDVRGLPWRVVQSPGWTDTATRGVVTAWAKAFVAGHSWATGWDVEEDFIVRAIQYRTPAGPTNYPGDAPFRAHDSPPVLRVRVTRFRGLPTIEASAAFPGDESLATVSAMLPHFTESLEAAHRNSLPL